jgi:hypothetical protein
MDPQVSRLYQECQKRKAILNHCTKKIKSVQDLSGGKFQPLQIDKKIGKEHSKQNKQSRKEKSKNFTVQGIPLVNGKEIQFNQF